MKKLLTKFGLFSQKNPQKDKRVSPQKFENFMKKNSVGKDLFKSIQKLSHE